MKYIVSLIMLLALSSAAVAQKPKVQPLPPATYVTMRDSTTSIDIVFLQGKGGSLSMDGRNVHLFNSFFEYIPVAKTGAPKAISIMWQINGREFLSGDVYLGDSIGYVVTQKNGKEYVNRINAQGNSFFKNQMKAKE